MLERHSAASVVTCVALLLFVTGLGTGGLPAFTGRPAAHLTGPMAPSVRSTASSLTSSARALLAGPGPPLGTWTNLTGMYTSAPGGRQNFAMAYDPALHEVVLFGGQDTSGTPLRDTWTYSSSGWTPLSLTPSPSPRWVAGFAYDAALSALVLFGGNSGGALLNDTWTFTSGGWRQIPTPVAPYPSSYGNLAYDSEDGYLFFLSTPTTSSPVTDWKFDGTRWVNITTYVTGAPPPLSYRAIDDPTDGYILFYGGSLPGCGLGLGLTWAYVHGKFTNLTPSQATNPREKVGIGTMGYDPNAGGVLMVSGYDQSCRLFQELWLFYEGQWRNLTSSLGPQPPGRWDSRLAFDSDVQTTLMFGGNHQSLGGSNYFIADTWNYTFTFRAGASASPFQGTAPVSVHFTASPIGGAPPYVDSWNFGDGTPASSASTVDHTYGTAGVYVATLNVTDITGRLAVAAFLINVTSGVFVATAGATPTSGIVPFTVHFTSTVSGGRSPYSTQWSFGGSLGGSTAASVNETYSTAGMYTATLIVHDSVGTSFSKNFTIVAVDPLIASGITATPSSGSAPLAVSFAVRWGGGLHPVTFSWSFGDQGTSTSGPNVTHNYTAAGTYTVTVGLTDSLGEAQKAMSNVTVSPASTSSAGSGLFSGPGEWLVVGAFVGAVAVATGIGILIGRRGRTGPTNADETGPA